MGAITTYPAQAPVIPVTGTTLAIAQVTTNQTGITTEVDVTGLSVTIIVPDARRIRLTMFSTNIGSTVAGDTVAVWIKEGATALSSQYVGSYKDVTNNGGAGNVVVMAVITPTAGSHTYRVTAARISGTGTVSILSGALQPSFLLAEDITSTPQPYPAASVPVGVLAQATRTSHFGVASATWTDVPNYSLNVTVPAGRVLKVSLSSMVFGTVANDPINIRIYRDAVLIRDVGDPDLEPSWGDSFHTEVLDSPSAGAHVYKVQISRQAGTGTANLGASVDNPGYFFVEDVTSTPAPANNAVSSTLGYAERTTYLNTVSTEISVTPLSVTVVVPAGRRLRITVKADVTVDTAAGRALGSILEDGVAVGRWVDRSGMSAGGYASAEASVIRTPTAGSHTYTVTLRGLSSNVNIESDTAHPAFILVEDITGVTSPYAIQVMPTSQTLAYAEATVSQGSITALTDLTNLTATVTVPEGRRLKITGYAFFTSTVATDTIDFRIREGSTDLKSWQRSGGFSFANAAQVVWIGTPTAGIHTYKLSALRAVGTGTVTMNVTDFGLAYSAFILIEDITGGAAAAAPVNVPVGRLAYAEATANQSFTTLADITGLSVNVAVPAGRVLKITAHLYLSSNTANDGILVYISEGATNYTRCEVDFPIANRGDVREFSAIVSPSAGAHTYNVRAERSAGSGTETSNAAATFPAYVVVEDITSTPAPATTAPSSTLAYAEIVASQTGITTEVDITGLSATVTVPAGRRLRITGSVLARPGVANDELIMLIREGGTQLQAVGQTLPNTARDEQFMREVVVTPTAGTHTYKLAMVRSAGTGAAQVTAGTGFPSFILVEDITGAAIPVPAGTGFWMPASVFPSNPQVGDLFFNNNTKKLYFWDGAAWTLPANVAGGILVTPQTNFTGSGAEALSKGTTEDVRYTTTAIQTFAGRRYRIRGLLTGTSGGAFNFAILSIRRGTTVGGTLLSSIYYARPSVGRQAMWAEAFDVPGAQASQQWVLTHSIDTSVCDLYAPSGIYVEDVGAA